MQLSHEEKLLVAQHRVSRLKSECPHPEDRREKWRTVSTAGWKCTVCGHEEYTE